MEENPRPDSLARSVRTLSIAVSILALVLLGQFALYAYSFYKASTFATHPAASPAATNRSSGQPDSRDFDTLSAEAKIRRSRGILVTRNQQEGSKRKAVVSEILKQPADAPLRYAVGDEYPDLSRYGEEAGGHGDGSVVFLVGSDSQLTVAYSYYDGRIGGLQDMRLDRLRALAAGKPVPAPPVGSAERPAGKPNTPSTPETSDTSERVTLQRATSATGVSSVYWIPRAVAESTPPWRPDAGAPPLSMTRAISIAKSASRRAHPGTGELRVSSISLQGMSCEPVIPDRWFYMVYLIPTAGSEGSWQVVLLNGEVVTPEIEPANSAGTKQKG